MATTLQSCIELLTALGEENGFVTLEEVIRHAPSLEKNPDNIDTIYFALNEKGIPVVDYVHDLPKYTKPQKRRYYDEDVDFLRLNHHNEVATPNFFVAAFDVMCTQFLPPFVENGWYKPPVFDYSVYPEEGDLLLFYCTQNHNTYPTQSPGIGVSLGWYYEAKYLKYRYLPFKAPVSQSRLERLLNLALVKEIHQKVDPKKLLFRISGIVFDDIASIGGISFASIII